MRPIRNNNTAISCGATAMNNNLRKVSCPACSVGCVAEPKAVVHSLSSAVSDRTLCRTTNYSIIVG